MLAVFQAAGYELGGPMSTGGLRPRDLRPGVQGEGRTGQLGVRTTLRAPVSAARAKTS